MYYINKDTELTYSEIQSYISKFMTSEFPRLAKLDRYYNNDNDINRRMFEDTSKPNNKISHSFAEYITETNVAMFVGTPITYISKDNIEDYLNVLDIANEQDINVDLATNCSKYGYAIQLIYLDENADIKLATLNNKQCVLIFSDDISQKLLYCIRFWKTISADDVITNWTEVYSAYDIKTYKNDILVNTQDNIFIDIPIVVYKNNTELKGDYENVISLIDEYDLLTSDTANEQDYFNNCYLYLNTDNVDSDDIANMKESRVLFGENLNPTFVLKNGESTNTEQEKTRLVSDIHKLSFTPDMSDDNFANNVSGVAMKYKLIGVLNKIQNKQRKFKNAIRERNRLLFDIMNVKSLSVPSYVDVVFTTNLPENELETAQMINLLRGLVSDETLLAQLPFVEDTAWELEQQTEVSDIYAE